MTLLIIVLCIIGGAGLILILPFKGARSLNLDRPNKRIHEADSILSRRLLIPGTDAYNRYYQLHPEYKGADDRARQAPGLLGEGSRYHDTATFAAAKANFEVIEFLGGLIQSSLSNQNGLNKNQGEESEKIDPEKTTRFIQQWLRNTGAHSIGFTRLKDYHLYSHKGRGTRANIPIEQKHKNAIAITVEMNHRMMQSAPEGSSVMESSEQYLRSGVLALKLAAWIKELGYEANAHIDGNYEVICPLVAVDAGLGTIGRMGLLMTPRLGPRVRIAVVTTNLPLICKEPVPDRTTLHFCTLCNKCSRVCPSAAIPNGPRTSIDGKKRWRIDSEKCYQYWTISGTDCGRCITACPYSHPDDSFHRFVRWGIKNNLLFRYLAIKLDDLFYGRKPAIKPLPEWLQIRNTE